MRIDILTLFPEMFESLRSSIIGRAVKSGLVEINIINIRDFSLDSNKRCDDYSYGGGAGMILTPQPLFDAIKYAKETKIIDCNQKQFENLEQMKISSLEKNENTLINEIKDDNLHLDEDKDSVKNKTYVIYLSPKGEVLKQKKVVNLAQNYEHLILICGHYEGIDERIIELCVDEEISIGDFILTGGEIPAMAITDAICRYIPNVLGNSETTCEESFSLDNLLEYPQYTRPYDFMGKKVPDVLISGNHKEIAKWRKQKSLEITKLRRPDLLG